MFDFNKTVDPTPNSLNQVIDTLLVLMDATHPLSDDYAKMLDQLTKLDKIKETSSPKSVSPDVMATILANLLGIGLVLHYEQLHVMTSKAFGLLIKTVVK